MAASICWFVFVFYVSHAVIKPNAITPRALASSHSHIFNLLPHLYYYMVIYPRLPSVLVAHIIALMQALPVISCKSVLLLTRQQVLQPAARLRYLIL
jgi:hypothetical protein